MSSDQLFFAVSTVIYASLSVEIGLVIGVGALVIASAVGRSL